MLKTGDFSKLSRVSVKMLEVYDDRERLETFFSIRRAELEAQAQDTARKLTLLDAAVKRLRKEDREGPLSRYGAREVPHTAGGDHRQLHLSGQLHPDHGGLCGGGGVDRGQRV